MKSNSLLVILLILTLLLSFIVYHYEEKVTRLEGRILIIENEKKNLIEENNLLKKNISSLKRELNEVKIELNATKIELNATLNTLKLRNPSYDELKSFLKEDDTDKKSYILGKHDCKNFALELRENAKAKGYNISYVIVDFIKNNEWGGHALNGAWLNNGEWVWIEPQNDFFEVSNQSLESVEKFIECMLGDVEVEQVVIIW